MREGVVGREGWRGKHTAQFREALGMKAVHVWRCAVTLSSVRTAHAGPEACHHHLHCRMPCWTGRPSGVTAARLRCLARSSACAPVCVRGEVRGSWMQFNNAERTHVSKHVRFNVWHTLQLVPVE